MFESKTIMLIQELLDLILAGEELCSAAVNEVRSFKSECFEVRKRVDQLLQMLKTLFRFIKSYHRTSVYLRPLDCILAQVTHEFELARTMVYECRRRNLFRWFFITCRSRNATLFRELFEVLDTSIVNMKWLLDVYDPQATTIGIKRYKHNTILEFVWSCIAAVQMGRELEDRVMAAKELALLAKYNKEIIFEEGAVPPLLKLLKGNSSSMEAQIVAANALCLLANGKERTTPIMKEMTETIIDRLLRKSPMKDQIQAANLVTSIVEHNPEIKEYDFFRENVIWRLVMLLSYESSKFKVKISCSKALFILTRGSVLNCTTLTETKGMLCLANLIGIEEDGETERELQYNCLMIIKEITSLAESNHGFRRLAFKRTSGAAKAVVDQLLGVIKEFDDTTLKLLAIKSVGSLARSFTAKDSRRVIGPLVSMLGHEDQEVASESAIALQKFICQKNGLKLQHLKSIIEFNGVPLLIKLLLGGYKESQIPPLMEYEALIALVAEHHELNELKSDTISKLQLKPATTHTESKSLLEGRIIVIILKQSKIGYNCLSSGSKILSEWITGIAEKLVKLQSKSLSMVMRYRTRFSTIPRILLFPNANCKEPALRCAMVYLGRGAMKEVVQKLRLMKKIVNQLENKVI